MRFLVEDYIWEEMYNPDFNSPEFEGIKNQAGLIINEGLPQEERLPKLNSIAIQQMKLLTANSGIKKLETQDE